MPVDNATLPTGEVAPVDGTPFDLRISRRLADALEETDSGDGFDHNFVVGKRRGSGGHDLALVARADYIDLDNDGIRSVEVYSDQPGLQFYTGNFLPAAGVGLEGKDGASYGRHGAFTMETQLYPDAVNRPEFGKDPVLRPGQTYEHNVVYKFVVF